MFSALSLKHAQPLWIQQYKEKLVLVVSMHMHENFVFPKSHSEHSYNSIPRNAPCNTEYDYIHMPTLIKR